MTAVIVGAFAGAIIAGGTMWFAEWLHFRYTAARLRRKREATR